MTTTTSSKQDLGAKVPPGSTCGRCWKDPCRCEQSARVAAPTFIAPPERHLERAPVQARPVAGKGVGAIRDWAFEVQRAFSKSPRVCLFAALYGYHAHLGSLTCDVSISALADEAGFNRTRLAGLQDQLIESGYLIHERNKGNIKVCRLAVPDVTASTDDVPW